VPALVFGVVFVAVVFIAGYLVWLARYGYPAPDTPQVLCFHKISDRFCWEGTWTTPARFFAYIDRLRVLGYRFIGMEQYLADVTSGRPGGPRVLLTFDDGYRELYDVVLPGLESRGVPFHVFLVTDYVGGQNDWELSLGRRAFRHLDWNQIEDMASRGVTFGSHGATHRDMTGVGSGEVRAELERSKVAIQERIGTPVRTVSYPFGRYDESVKTVVKELGFVAAFSLYPSHPNSHFDPHAVRRCAVYIIDPVALIETKLEPGPLFWLEELKCRAINAVAVLTPSLKRFTRDRSPGDGPPRHPLRPDRDTGCRSGRDSRGARPQQPAPVETGSPATQRRRGR
jgi:peptidoglycan/xylan/chitin deacetylase (PgdA/CDA1 family)